MLTEEIKNLVQLTAIEAFVYGVETTYVAYNNCFSTVSSIALLVEDILVTIPTVSETIQFDSTADEEWELVNVEVISASTKVQVFNR